MEMWNIIYYEKENKSKPVEEFIQQLPWKLLSKTLDSIEQLAIHGNQLRYPHVSHIDGKLWELRVKFAGDISRIFYFMHVGNNIVLLHGFVKKTQKTPRREIEIARSYLDAYLRRNHNDI